MQENEDYGRDYSDYPGLMQCFNSIEENDGSVTTTNADEKYV